MKLPDFLTQDELGFITVTDHRIGLTDIVNLYNEGYSAEMIACEFDLVPLADIHKVIAFYLENREAVNAYLQEEEAECEKQRAATPPGITLADLRRRMEAMRKAKAS